MKHFIALTASIAALFSKVSAGIPPNDGKFFYMEMAHKHNTGTMNKGSHYYVPMQAFGGGESKASWDTIPAVPTSNEQGLEVANANCGRCGGI